MLCQVVLTGPSNGGAWLRVLIQEGCGPLGRQNRSPDGGGVGDVWPHGGDLLGPTLGWG